VSLGRSAVVLLVACVAAVRPAAAQSRFEIGAAATWTGGFDAGGQDALETRSPSSGSTPLTLFGTSSRVQSAPGAIARVGVFLTSRLAVEGHAEYSRPTLRTTFQDDFEGATGGAAENTIASFVIGGSAVLYFGSARLTPFVSAGAGWLRQLDEEQVLVVTGLELHAGGGVKYGLSRHVSIRVEATASARDKSIAFDEKRRVVPVIAGGMAYRF